MFFPKGMEEQVDAGRAKAIGVSNFNKDQVEKLVNSARIPVSNNQVELHLYMQQPELVKYCQENKVTVTSYGTLGSPGRKEFFDKIGLPFEYVSLSSSVERTQCQVKWSVRRNVQKFTILYNNFRKLSVC